MQFLLFNVFLEWKRFIFCYNNVFTSNKNNREDFKLLFIVDLYFSCTSCCENNIEHLGFNQHNVPRAIITPENKE